MENKAAGTITMNAFYYPNVNVYIMEEEDILQKYNFGLHMSGQSIFTRNTPK